MSIYTGNWETMTISYVVLKGTRFHVLEVGWLECDEAFVVCGGNMSLKSTENQPFINKRRELPIYCILIKCDAKATQLIMCTALKLVNYVN